jgi:hypothetical protein
MDGFSSIRFYFNANTVARASMDAHCVEVKLAHGKTIRLSGGVLDDVRRVAIALAMEGCFVGAYRDESSAQ